MKPPRFTLSALLVVVTIAAISLGVWRIGYSRRNVTPKDADRIKVGMTDWQVRYFLGAPHRNHFPNMNAWTYDIEGDREECLGITFKDGRACFVGRHFPW